MILFDLQVEIILLDIILLYYYVILDCKFGESSVLFILFVFIFLGDK